MVFSFSAFIEVDPWMLQLVASDSSLVRTTCGLVMGYILGSGAWCLKTSATKCRNQRTKVRKER